jgi:hypothetical protein
MAHTHSLGIAEFDPNAEETGIVPQLMAGDTPAFATRDVPILAAASAIPQYTPLKYASGAWAPWTVGTVIAGIAMYAIPNLADDQRAAIAVAGMFNIDAIAWPADTTEADVEAGSVGTPLQFRKLLYSDQRVVKGDLLVGPDNQPPPEVEPEPPGP